VAVASARFGPDNSDDPRFSGPLVHRFRGIRSSTPHATYRDTECKHITAVQDRPIVVSAAQAASATYNGRVATDGGKPEDDEDNESVGSESAADSETTKSFSRQTATRDDSEDYLSSYSQNVFRDKTETTGVVDLE
jgi:hypothetical protein